MRAIVILAIGIYLGRQVYLQYDAQHKRLSAEELQIRWKSALRRMGYSPLEVERITSRLIKYTHYAND